MTVKFRSRRIFGILLAILFAVNDVLIWLLRLRGLESSLMTFIAWIPSIILAVAFFLKKERIHNLVTAIALFSGCLLELYRLIYQLTDYYYSYVDTFLIIMVAVYGLLGGAFVSNKRNKPIRIAAAIATIVLVMLFSYAETFSYIIYSIFSLQIYNSFGYFNVFGIIALMIILLDLMSGNSSALNKDTQKEIVISREIISVKDLLMFVEDEFKSGKISEEEYSRKRNEILNQL